jgi:hypothetical protein
VLCTYWARHSIQSFVSAHLIFRMILLGGNINNSRVQMTLMHTEVTIWSKVTRLWKWVEVPGFEPCS